MSPDPDASQLPTQTETKLKINPWTFVPVLYVLQAIPVAMVQDLASIIYKDLGIGDSDITKWTSLIALPWSLQMLMGPLVEFSAQKRKWIVAGQLILTILIALTPFTLGVPNAFAISLMLLGCTAVVSALVNTAQDGFYMLAMPSKDLQAAFAGVQSTFFRVGRLFVIGLLVIFAGKLMDFSSSKVETRGNLFMGIKKKDSTIGYLRQATVHVNQGNLVTEKNEPLEPKVEIPIVADRYEIKGGQVLAYQGEKEVLKKDLGLWELKASLDPAANANPDASSMQQVGNVMSGSITGTPAKRTFPAPTAWFITLIACAIVYGLGALQNRFALPKPEADVVPVSASGRGEIRKNLGRTGLIAVLYTAIYFAVSALWKLGTDAIGHLIKNEKWQLPPKGLYLGLDFGLSGVWAEVLQFLVCIPIGILAVFLVRRSLKGTEMGDAITSYFKLPGIYAIFGFMLFYRFGEAMVAKMSPLFLKAELSNGGLALTNEQLGLVKGTIGLAGIILGGILGGLFISKQGLKKSFWPLAICMHAPIALYWLISLDGIRQSVPIAGVAVVDFVDQFGYGVGFAGYMVYMMQVAQRGKYQTIWYAIGTGLAATFIQLSGLLAGVLKDSFGYHGFFFSALLFAIPGLIALRMVPLDDDKSGEPVAPVAA